MYSRDLIMVAAYLKNVSFEGLINSLPGIIWFKNQELNYIASSQQLNEFVGFPVKDYIIGKNDYQLPWEQFAKVYQDGNKKIISTGKSIIFLHPMQMFNSQQIIILTQKSPVYDESQKIVGVNGTVSVVATLECFQNILKLNQYDYSVTGKNKNYDPIQYELSNDFSQFDLSKRETICLFYLIRGKTAKEIAEIIYLSKRTVEKHIDNIRLKLHCNTKSEIIAKAIDAGFVYLIPNDFLIKFINRARF